MNFYKVNIHATTTEIKLQIIANSPESSCVLGRDFLTDIMIQSSSLLMPVFWMAAFLNNKLILFTHFNSLIFQLYCIPLRYADNGTMTQTSLDSGKYTALRQGWGEEWDRWVMGLMNSALPEMALFWGTNSLRLTLLQAPHCTEPCLQIFASPKAGFRPFSFLTPKAFPKASSLSVWVSYHLLLPCDCVSFMFTMSL